MATVARKVGVVVSGLSGLHNVALKAVYANAAAGDITQLGTDTVLLIADVDSTDAHDRNTLVAMAQAAVDELRRQLFLVKTPATTSASSVTTYHSRGA